MPDPDPPGPLDEATFGRWVEQFRGPLIGLSASWGPSWRDAEELAQDTFAEAWLGRARFRGRPDDVAAVGAWLRGIAFRLNAARERARARRPALAEAELGAAGVDGLAPEALATGATDEASQAVDEARLAALRLAFAGLPPHQQVVLRMHYLERTTQREVAALLGLTPEAVEGRLYRARQALRDRLQRVQKLQEARR